MDELSKMKEGLSTFSYFSKLNEDEIKEACAIGKIKTYKPNETILGDGVASTNYNYTYFILYGQCRLIHLLKTNKKRDSKSSNETFRKHFIDVCLFDSEGCFNLGEPLIDKSIVAVNNVKCMLLPKHWLWRKNTSNIWGRLKRYLERKIPEEEKIVRDFKLEKKWEKYKVDLINDILKNKKSKTTMTTNDIPYSIRVHERPFGP